MERVTALAYPLWQVCSYTISIISYKIVNMVYWFLRVPSQALCDRIFSTWQECALFQYSRDLADCVTMAEMY